MQCSRALLETRSSIPNGAAMMRPSSARGSEAVSVEDATLPTGELGMSCQKVGSLDEQEPFCRQVLVRGIFKLLRIVYLAETIKSSFRKLDNIEKYTISQLFIFILDALYY